MLTFTMQLSESTGASTGSGAAFTHTHARARGICYESQLYDVAIRFSVCRWIDYSHVSGRDLVFLVCTSPHPADLQIEPHRQTTGSSHDASRNASLGRKSDGCSVAHPTVRTAQSYTVASCRSVAVFDAATVGCE